VFAKLPVNVPPPLLEKSPLPSTAYENGVVSAPFDL
jgi:hypothetical protein